MLPANEIALALKPVTDLFTSLGISYYLGGSVASSAYGIARSTLDVDVVSNLKLEHIPKLVSNLENDYYISEESIKNAIRHASSFNLVHLETSLKIDIFITKNRAYDQIAASRAREDSISLEANAPHFYLASAEDIVLAKLEWFKSGGLTSERQWQDILGVLRVQQSLDLDYMRLWATKLDLSDLLEKVLQER